MQSLCLGQSRVIGSAKLMTLFDSVQLSSEFERRLQHGSAMKSL